MKGLSLTQPWASLVAIGAKSIETRSWATAYRGPIAIHAAKAMPRACRAFAYADPAGQVLTAAGIRLGGDCRNLPKGAILAVARLTGIARTEEIIAMSHGLLRHELAFGDYAPGRFGWVLTDVRRLPVPIPCKGALGVWDLPIEIAHEVAEAVQLAVP
jgi:activating signal cointegrator 1